MNDAIEIRTIRLMPSDRRNLAYVMRALAANNHSARPVTVTAAIREALRIAALSLEIGNAFPES